MREWKGMKRRESATASGAPHLLVNTRYEVDGELQRRRGLEKITNTGATVAAAYWHPLTGYVVLLRTSGGAIESVSV